MALIVINGRLGVKPEQKNSKSGSSYMSFSVALSEKRGGKEETTWFKCIWMNAEGSTILNFLDKGSLVQITGTLLKPKAFQKKDGSYDVDLTIMVHAVNFLPISKQSDPAVSVNAPISERGTSKGQEFVQDEIPF
jgi:single-strand DNA-binding protein